jgi:hypothetical protein
MYARDELQDTLTEALLWRIQALDAKPGAGGRRGQAGVTAEFLGRLLVLEKEQAQICGIIARRCSLPSKKGENEKGISG